MPDGTYSRVTEERAKLVTPKPPPVSDPPASTTGAIVVRGHGLKASIPVAAVAALVAALGARMIPTPTTTDEAVRRMETQAQIQQLRDEQWRADVTRQLEAIREAQRTSDNELRNRMVILETRIRERRSEP